MNTTLFRSSCSWNRDRAVTKTEKITGKGDSADKARSQRAKGTDGDNKSTAPPQAAVEAEGGGGWDAVRGQYRGAAASTRSAVAPVAMVVVEALQRGGGPRGGVGSKGFFGTDGLDLFGRAGA